ncbi:MAG TPA: hypothetical protein VHM25_05340, partial [Polyangiaceae bacterium]|nr:hypothetical protein [Polyangiaceae bacterium]
MPISVPPFESLAPLVERVLGDAQPQLVEIEGGASTRRFFRVTSAAGPSAVAMYVPLPSQELTKAQETG